MTARRAFVLYSKPGCHLCHDLRVLLDELQPEFGLTVEEIDITSDAELFARFREEIPVLLLNGREVARGRISESDLLNAIRLEPQDP